MTPECRATVHARRSSELDEGASAEALVFDAATRMFWRNLRARAGPAPVRALGADPTAYDLPGAAALGAPARHLPEVPTRACAQGFERLCVETLKMAPGRQAQA